jgi:hypothetical protein
VVGPEARASSPRAAVATGRSSLASHAPLLVALFLTTAIYRRALATFFAQDDITFLSRAAGLEPANWGFRPLSEGAAFRIEHALFGLDPFGYHAVNLLLHLLNVAGVYVLGLRLTGSRAAAGAAAAMFGLTPLAFTPLHWASGEVELLTGALLLGATLLHVDSRGGEGIGPWAAAAVALAAMLSKETAIAWILVVGLIEWRSGHVQRRALVPAALACALLLLFNAGVAQKFQASEAYARTAAPTFLAQNLLTYLRWCVAFWQPIPDAVAAVDPGAWRVGVPVLLVAAAAIGMSRRDPRHGVEIGSGWWLAFLLPVLPLTHHSYLYYAYIPSMGGAIAVAAAGRGLLGRRPRQQALAIGWTALAVYALIAARSIETRATATRDALPADRTLRDAMLLRHALPALHAAALPPGSAIAFVNPAPGPRFDLTTGAATRAADLARRTSYMPLEAALRGGETLRLFEPQLTYLGFATTIPAAWENAECFYYEQRGWLRAWGRGQRALLQQAAVQMSAGRYASAESTFLRVRSLGDTIPAALAGQVAALMALGRRNEARIVADEARRRWPDPPGAAMPSQNAPRPPGVAR